MTSDEGALFLGIGLNESVVATTTKNAKLSSKLVQVIRAAGAEAGCDRAKGQLLYAIASRLPSTTWQHADLLARYVSEGKLRTGVQLDEALSFLKKYHAGTADVDVAAFDEAAGVHVDLSEDDVRRLVAEVIEGMREELVAERYQLPLNKLLSRVREGPLKFADGRLVKDEVEAARAALLGPKTEADDEAARMQSKASKGKKKGGKKGGKKGEETKTEGGASGAGASAGAGAEGGSKVEDLGASDQTKAAGFAARDLAAAVNSPALVEEHLRVTGGVLRTRFPPEPNGYLHIGHAASMFLNFRGSFERLGKQGETILRYDDTNPEAESQEYIDSIRDAVLWMGWRPCRVTFSSDYFEELYGLAVELIRRGKAYVCHQTKEEMQRSRDLARSRTGNPNSPWRNRSVEENLREFENMRKGKYAAGAATLRMKMDMTSPNPNMWDPVAYRIKFVPHPHVGNKWCIYPSYDFTHCLVDSLEHIDYSLCTLEFESRRDTYYWLLEALDMWRPHVWEFGRLNVAHTMMSKRKLLKMVKDGIVRGWDDPRMPTVMGLRRRGYPAEALNEFCAEASVSRATSTMLELERLEFFIRRYLDDHSPRSFAVLQPLEVTLVNMDPTELAWVESSVHPKKAEMGTRRLPFQARLFIDRSDFRMEDSPKYYGLSPGSVVGLKYANRCIKCVDVQCDESGTPIALRAEVMSPEEAEAFAKEIGKKRFSFIHWVAGSKPGDRPAAAELRVYNHLFNSRNPSEVEDWLADLNPESEVVYRDALVFDHMLEAKVGESFQLERVGYFAVDPDTTPGHPVLNRTVGLRESAVKKKM